MEEVSCKLVQVPESETNLQDGNLSEDVGYQKIRRAFC